MYLMLILNMFNLCCRLGGIPVGVIAVETRTVELDIPADPANIDSEQKVNALNNYEIPDSTPGAIFTNPSQLCDQANLFFDCIHPIVGRLPVKRFAWLQSCEVNMTPEFFYEVAT
jgi:hypothetical protein